MLGKSYTERIDEMRRKDREVTGLEDMLAILDECDVIRLGLCAGGQPYIVPLFFAYQVIDEALSIYFHCAVEGKKMEIISENNRVCFEADCACHIIEAENACAWSASYRSVMGEGIIGKLDSGQQKTAALDLIMERYGFKGEPRYDPQELDSVAVLRMDVRSMSAKQKN